MDALTLVGRHLPVKVGTGDTVMGALTDSTGWVIVDALIGGAVGWLIAPKEQEVGYALGGAAATGLAGVIGLVGLLGWRYAVAPNLKDSKVRENPLPRSSPRQARDYVAVSNSGRVIAGPFAHYDSAKRHADKAGGYVKFASEAGTRKRVEMVRGAPRFVRYYYRGRPHGWLDRKKREWVKSRPLSAR